MEFAQHNTSHVFEHWDSKKIGCFRRNAQGAAPKVARTEVFFGKVKLLNANSSMGYPTQEIISN
jgi:hypothetical protein